MVSRDNSCRYCIAGSRFLLRLGGMPEEQIRRLEQDLLTPDLGEREREALEFARRLSRANPMPGRGDLEKREALAAYNEELEARGLPRLAIGVGLHRGGGIAALVGSRERKEFTLVGSTINVAARVQDHTRQLDADILLTGAVRSGLDPRFRLRELPPADLKGIEGRVDVWAVEGLDEGSR